MCFVQPHRNGGAARRFRKRLIAQFGNARVVVTDKLRRYAKPIKDLAPNAHHRAHNGLNNRIEGAHGPTRKREKMSGRFKSPRQAQRFLSAHDQINVVFRPLPSVRHILPQHEQTCSGSGTTTPQSYRPESGTLGPTRLDGRNLAIPSGAIGAPHRAKLCGIRSGSDPSSGGMRARSSAGPHTQTSLPRRRLLPKRPTASIARCGRGLPGRVRRRWSRRGSADAAACAGSYRPAAMARSRSCG